MMFAKIVYFAFLIVSCECVSGRISRQISNPPPVQNIPPTIDSGNIQNNIGVDGLLGVLANLGLSNIIVGPLDNLSNLSIVDKTNAERPCHIDFIECIRQYFAEHAKCKESNAPVPDPLTRAISTTFISRVNLTLTALDVTYSGLNGNVEEFFVNKETDNLVITIQFRNVTYYSKDTVFRFHRRGKEPIVNLDYFFINFNSFSTTTVIPCINNLRLDKSETYAFIDDRNPRLSIGPKAFVSSDPAVPATLPALLADIPTSVQEFFLTEAAFMASTFIQNNICNFGLNIL